MNIKGIHRTLENNAFLRVVIAGVFVVLFTFGVRAMNSGPASAPDYEPGIAGQEVVIEVLPGEAGAQIADKLEAAGVVKSALAFFRVAVGDENSKRIAPGEHLIQTQIPATTALQQLLDAKRIPNLIKVRDGARWAEVREALVAFGLSEQEINVALKQISIPEDFSTRKVEGFLYPAQYSFNKGVSAEQVLAKMLEKFAWATKEINWMSLKGYSPYEILTMASLVETEGTPDVFGKVARVILNRLERGMPLQFDSTVHYALNRRGEIRVSIADTKIPSRYNTFLNRGLPPSPIGSPTVKAIEAVVNAPSGDWIYFVTVKPKETRFTSSYDEFLIWKAEYKRNFKAGLFE